MLTADEFAEYDAANPQVWRAFDRIAHEMCASGQRRIGAKAIAERLRWDSGVAGSGEFKINDHWTAFYVRRFQHVYPRWADRFAVRSSAADVPVAVGGQGRLW